MTKRTAAFALASGIACSIAVGAAPGLKGVRALIAHGGVLEAPVRIEDSVVATALMRGLMTASDYDGVVEGSRACIEVAVFLPNASTAYLANSQLELREADYSILLYPAVGNDPAAAWLSGRFVRVPATQLKQLSTWGIPTSVAPGVGTC